MTASNAFRAFGIGAATGLRSMTGPAFAFADRAGNWNWALRATAVAEYVVDKLPNTPSRTQPAGLAVRAIAAAIAAAYLGAAYRQACAKRDLPPLAAALAEDGLAIALAWSAVPHKHG